MRQWLFTSLLTLLTFGLLILWLKQSYDFDLRALLQVSPLFLAMGVMLSLLDLALRGARIQLVTNQVGGAIRFWQGVRIVLAVDFFAAISPSRIAGEPARVAGLMRYGVGGSKALVVAGVEAVLDLGYLFIALPFFFWLTRGEDSNLLQIVRFIAVAAIGVVFVFILVLFLRDSVVARLVGRLKQWAPGLYRLLSRRERWNLVEGVQELRANLFRLLRGPWWCLPLGVLLTCGWWVVRFGALFWIAMVLGFHLSVVEIFWPQFLIHNSIILTPMPVSGGLFEASFLFIYQEMIPRYLLPSAMVLWRFFTYYVFVVFGAVTTTRLMWRVVTERLAIQRVQRRQRSQDEDLTGLSVPQPPLS